MAHEVRFTEDAEQDLDELYEFVARYDSAQSADRLLNRIEKICASLAHSPSRGAHPEELHAIGMREYREIFFKPYRIIYRLHERAVVVYLIADGRRDMQTLLRQRLLRTR